MSTIMKEIGPGELFITKNDGTCEKLGDIIDGEISLKTQRFSGGFTKYAIHNFRREKSDSQI
jgi:hypothetical protein